MEAVSKLRPWEDRATPICERIKTWNGYVAELPQSERDRYRRLRDGLDSLSIPYQLARDPYYRLQARMDGLRDEARAQGGAVVMLEDWRFKQLEVSDLDEAVGKYRCAGLEPPARLVAEIASRRAQDAEASRCAADPACAAAKKRERITELRQAMCEAEGQRQAAKDGIREEWRYAHQAGVVNLQNLSDQRTLLEIHDGQIAERQDEWEELTGRRFAAKRDCGTAAK